MSASATPPRSPAPDDANAPARSGVSRRSLMQLLTLAAGASIAPAVLAPRRAHAGMAEIPRRVIFVYLQSGSMPGRWEPVGVGVAPPSATSWSVNPDLHGALAPYRSDLNYVENLDMVSALDDPTGAANAHFGGSTHATAAANRLAPNRAGGLSIDQFIARRINSPRPVTLLPSLEIWGNGGNHEHLMSTDEMGTALPRLENPLDVYARLFPAPLAMDAQVAARAARAREFLRGRYPALASRLGREDRARVEQHLQTLSDLHARMGEVSTRAALRPPRGVLDPYNALAARRAMGMNPSEGEWYRARMELLVLLAVAAVQTDTTRVVSIDLNDAPDEECGYTRQFGSDIGDTHGLIHEVMNPSRPLSRDPAAIEVIRRQFLASMRYVGMLCEQLAARTESDGQRLLDHTTVVFVSQIADGSHALERLPWFTVGGAGMGLRTGQYVRRGRTPRAGGGTVGRAHNDFLLTIANAMGVGATTFGQPAVCTGPIRELLR